MDPKDNQINGGGGTYNDLNDYKAITTGVGSATGAGGNSVGFGGYNPVTYPVTPHPCPSCGHCPTCGRGGYHTYPWYPVYPGYPTYPTITYTYTT